MKRLIVLGFGLMLTAVLTGCCCLPSCGGGGYGGYGYGGCGPGGCTVPAGAVPAATMYAPACSSCAY